MAPLFAAIRGLGPGPQGLRAAAGGARPAAVQVGPLRQPPRPGLRCDVGGFTVLTSTSAWLGHGSVMVRSSVGIISQALHFGTRKKMVLPLGKVFNQREHTRVYISACVSVPTSNFFPTRPFRRLPGGPGRPRGRLQRAAPAGRRAGRRRGSPGLSGRAAAAAPPSPRCVGPNQRVWPTFLARFAPVDAMHQVHQSRRCGVHWNQCLPGSGLRYADCCAVCSLRAAAPVLVGGI